MFTLSMNLDYVIDGLQLNIAYDAVLRVFKLQKDERFTDSEKISLSLEILLKKPNKIKRYSRDQKIQLFNKILQAYLMPKQKSKEPDVKAFDFEQDAEYIYSSFLQAYNIDLIYQKGKLDWLKFIALFQGLPDNTKIKEVIGIRTRKIPAPTKYNADEITALHEAKAYYSLELTEEEKKTQFQKGLDKLGSTLSSMAVKRND